MRSKFLLLAALVAAPGLTHAEESSYSITMDFPFVSDYVFRGIKYADNSIQPSLAFSTGNFYAGIWTNQPVTGGIPNEFDYNIGYTLPLPADWSVDMGATFYDYPETAGGDEQFEPYVGLVGSFESGLSTSLYLYHETEFDVTTFQASLGYAMDLSSTLSMDLGADLGSVQMAGNGDYTYWQLSSTLNAKLKDNASAYLGVTYSSTDLDSTVNPEGDGVVFLTTGLKLGF